MKMKNLFCLGFKGGGVLLLSIFLMGAEFQPGDLLLQEAVVYRQEGLELQAVGELERAATAYRKAIVIYPGYVDAYNDLGVVLESLDKTGLAEEAYKSALKLNPDFAPTHSNLAMLYERNGSIEGAAEHWSCRVRLGPPQDPWVLAARRKLTEYNVAIPKSPKELAKERKAKIRLGMQEAKSHLRAKRWDEAIAAYERVLAVDPSHKRASRGIRSAQRRAEKDQMRQERELRKAQEKLSLAEQRADAARSRAAERAQAEQERLERQADAARMRAKRAGTAAAERPRRGLEVEPALRDDDYSIEEDFEVIEAEQTPIELPAVVAVAPAPVQVSADAQAIASELVRERSEVRQRTVSELRDRAVTAMRKGNYADAVRNYEQILALDPSHREAQRGLERAERALAKKTKAARTKR